MNLQFSEPAAWTITEGRIVQLFENLACLGGQNSINGDAKCEKVALIKCFFKHQNEKLRG